METLRALPFAAVLTLPACGGSTPPAPPKTPAPPTSAAPAKTPDAPKPEAKTVKPAAEEKNDDPTESKEPIEMEVILDKKTPKSKFPKATTGDKECWQQVGLSGDHEKDYQQVIEKCGAPTGLLEYAKAARGRVHSQKDKRDTYVVKMAPGLCYRYFAVGDGNIQDLDILVMKPSGALVADDKTTSPVAILHNDQPWCMDEETEYQFHVEVDGPGHGGYVFAVWARPKK